MSFFRDLYETYYDKEVSNMVMTVLSIIVGVAGSLISVAGLIVLYFEDEMKDIDDENDKES